MAFYHVNILTADGKSFHSGHTAGGPVFLSPSAAEISIQACQKMSGQKCGGGNLHMAKALSCLILLVLHGSSLLHVYICIVFGSVAVEDLT